MDTIIEPTQDFDFSKINLSSPTGIQGGAYFTKLLYNQKPLYIQTPKSQTRQGFVKSGKKIYCDLMFDHNAEIFINWLEQLEEKCHNLVYEKSNLWFQNSLELNDIESAFSSMIRVYKSGKYYLIRTNVKMNNSSSSIKIFDENETPVVLEDVKPDNSIISILEIQGIKFTSRNFQFELDLKQVMVLNNEPLFDQVVIKKNPSSSLPTKREMITSMDESLSLEKDKKPLFSDKSESMDKSEQILDSVDLDSSFFSNETKTSDNILAEKESLNHVLLQTPNNTIEESLEKNEESLEHPTEELSFIELKQEDLEEPLKEFTIDLDNSIDPLSLKKPNQVYYELYKQARVKAKEAKKAAIIAFLEAKNIKKTYMIEHLDESDSEIDDDIDGISESDLEGL